MRNILAFAAVLCLVATTAMAGPKAGQWGVGIDHFSYAGMAGDDTHANLSYGLDDASAVRVGLGFDGGMGLAGDAKAGKVISLAVEYRMYKANSGKVSPFMGVGLNLSGDFDAFGDTMHAVVGGSLGGEYWYNDNISIDASFGVAIDHQKDATNLVFGTTGVGFNLYW